MELTSAVLAVAMLCLALPQAALPKTTAPVETPAPRHVNLTDLLSLAGPYGTFLDHLTRTDVIRTFQSQANVTDQGVTIFAPEDSAFKAVDGAALANLTADQLRSLMLCHAMPRFYPLSAFSALAASSPVPTFAGGQCAVNVTDAAGTIHVVSSWARAKLVSSAYSTSPVAVYSLDRVLLPEQVFPTEPTVAPAPAAHGGNANATDGAPAAAEHGAKSLSCRVGAGRVFVGYKAHIFRVSDDVDGELFVFVRTYGECLLLWEEFVLLVHIVGGVFVRTTDTQACQMTGLGGEELHQH